MTLSRCKCHEALFAAIAQNFGRQGLHIMTASMSLVHESCGTGHFTVDGADNDLRKALTIGSDGVHRGQSRALSVASRAGVSLQTQDKCGLGQLKVAADETGPGERQRRRARELRAGNSASWHFIATRSYADSPASQLTSSPSLSLSWPSPISSKPKLSRTALILGLQAHAGS